MQQPSLIPEGQWRRGLALLLLSLQVGCAGAQDEHPSKYQYDATPTPAADNVDRCATPDEGCACSNPGEIIDCGKIVVKVNNYETCYEGSRICTEAATWGPCAADQVIVQLIK
jgi:hypothetical protein